MGNHEEHIAAMPAQFRFRPRPQTDPIDMEFILPEVDPILRASLITVRLETVAAVYRGIADGAAKAAAIVAKGARG